VPATTITFELDEAPDRVFDYIADVRNELRWQKDMLRAEKTSDGPLGDATTFDTEYRGFGRMTLTLSEYRRPEHLVFLGEGPRMWMRFVMDVAARAGGGSQVTFAIDMRPQGAFRLFTPLLSLGLPREMAKRPEQFRSALAADPV
jgi:uncharacterized protein YndB with AHSA1/START domain